MIIYFHQLYAKTLLIINKNASSVFIAAAVICGMFVADNTQREMHIVREGIRNRLESAAPISAIIIGDELVHASVSLPLFYERRMYLPAWFDRAGKPGPIKALIDVIRDSERDGLRPRDYHLARIENLLRDVSARKVKKVDRSVNLMVDLDLLCTDAFLLLAAHLLAGRIDPETLDPEWKAVRREADFVGILQDALESGDIAKSTAVLLPVHRGYSKLRHARERLQQVSLRGGNPLLAPGATLRTGDSGERVGVLRKILINTGDLDRAASEADDRFDSDLEKAVKRFQLRHGLDIDGAVGPKTLEALNIPVERRIRQIELNMERWRWLPQDLGKHHVIVNIADFGLGVFEGGEMVIHMKAIVGRNYRRTPVFSDSITYVVLNPCWNVPPNVAEIDIVPALFGNVDYLQQNNIKLFHGWGSDMREIDPADVDWGHVNIKRSNYWFRQDPGPANALGRIKFMFPNKFDVYLHDTPARGLFAKNIRNFSSGCVRIENALELAVHLLRGSPTWTRERLVAALDTERDLIVRLPQPVPIHILYWTAWADDDGTMHFRNDVYGRDALLDRALREDPPIPRS